MKIGLAHFRVGETDGVSLEMEKWRKVLAELGHEVLFISGSPEDSEIYIPELHYLNPLNKKFVINAYDSMADYGDAQKFEQELLAFAKVIEEKLIMAVQKNQIEMLIINNIWSLGWGLPAGIAFYRTVNKLNLSCIAHHHDFHWERERYQNPTCLFVENLLRNYFPPRDLQVKHVVINQLAQKELKKRVGVEATVVPNIFDFDAPLWGKDEYNQNMRQQLGIQESDLVILQATRVNERKAIELSIEFVGELEKHRERLKGILYNGGTFNQDSKIYLVMAGLVEADVHYVDLLKELAKKCGVNLKWINDRIAASRRDRNGVKMYSLWDAYVIADLITYPSILEGWGNQFLEGLFAKKPLLVYEYPVFESDIAKNGFEIISLGNKHWKEQGLVKVVPEVITECALKGIELLKNSEIREEVVEKNFVLARENYSYQVLKQLLIKLING